MTGLFDLIGILSRSGTSAPRSSRGRRATSHGRGAPATGTGGGAGPPGQRGPAGGEFFSSPACTKTVPKHYFRPLRPSPPPCPEPHFGPDFGCKFAQGWVRRGLRLEKNWHVPMANPLKSPQKCQNAALQRRLRARCGALPVGARSTPTLDVDAIMCTHHMQPPFPKIAPPWVGGEQRRRPN